MALPAQSSEYSTFSVQVERGLLDALALADSDPGSRLLVALSGGVDSTSLMLSLAEIRQRKALHLFACHVNHNLRDKESDDDEDFCRRLCTDLDVPFAVEHVGDEQSTLWKSKSQKPSENELRELRYALLSKNAREVGAGLILTAHTLDDQHETMLFRLFRGTSPSGLIGIRPFRKLEKESDVFLIRPMLTVSRADCLRYLAEKNVHARFDSSNIDPTYRRNYIRHQIIPAIEKEFPGWGRSLSRIRELIACQEELLDDLSRKAAGEILIERQEGRLVFDLTEFAELPLALKRRLIVNTLHGFDLDSDFETVARVLALADFSSTDSALTLSETLEVRIEQSQESRYLVWSRLEKDLENDRLRYLQAQGTEVRLPADTQKSVSNIVSWLDCSLRVEKLEDRTAMQKSLTFPPAGALEALVDLSFVEPPLCIRLRRPGDFIQPFGMNCRVRLKQYLHTHKIERKQSFALQVDLSAAVVLACGDEVLWVPQIGISELLRVRSAPTHRLCFQKLSHDGPVIA